MQFVLVNHGLLGAVLGVCKAPMSTVVHCTSAGTSTSGKLDAVRFRATDDLLSTLLR